MLHNYKIQTEEIQHASQTLRQSGMLFRGAHANLSVRVNDNTMVMTSGGDVANLTADDFAEISLNGDVLNGEIAPTMKEIVDMHAAIYRERADVGAVIHSHAPHITAFGLAHKPIPLVYEPLLRYGLTEPVPVAPWAPRGSKQSVDGIINYAKQSRGIKAVILANHGVLVFDENIKAATQLLTTLDEAAELIVSATTLGGAKPLPAEAINAVIERMKEFSKA